MSIESDQLDAAVLAAALGPAKVATSLATVEMYPLGELMKAADKLKQNVGVRKPHRGMYLSKLVPPGAQ